jgi:hypothetical protein
MRLRAWNARNRLTHTARFGASPKFRAWLCCFSGSRFHQISLERKIGTSPRSRTPHCFVRSDACASGARDIVWQRARELNSYRRLSPSPFSRRISTPHAALYNSAQRSLLRVIKSWLVPLGCNVAKHTLCGWSSRGRTCVTCFRDRRPAIRRQTNNPRQFLAYHTSSLSTVSSVRSVCLAHSKGIKPLFAGLESARLSESRVHKLVQCQGIEPCGP